MKAKICIAALCICIISLLATGSFAANDTAKDRSAAQAVGNGPKDIPPGWEKIVFIHYRKAPGKPEGSPGKPKPPKESSCYDFIARGAMWLDAEIIEVDGTNGQGLDPALVYGEIATAADTWQAQTGTTLFSDIVPASAPLVVNEEAPDNRNMIVFGDLDTPGAIAVTIVWGYFGGPPSSRRIIEFDMIFDDVDFDWGFGSDTAFMDVQNIAAHELGHAWGLGDVYETACSAVTMYGYSWEGDIEKRTLAQPDITALQTLYGGL